jgi:small-conductance mechanosensitive channel
MKAVPETGQPMSDPVPQPTSEPVPDSVTPETETAPAAAEAVEEGFFNPDIDQFVPEAALPIWETLAEYPWLLVPVLILLGWGIGRILTWTVARALNEVTRRTDTDVDDQLADLLVGVISPTVVILSMMVSAVILPLSKSIENLTERVLATLLLFILMRAGLKAVRLILMSLSQNRDTFRMIEERTIPLFDMLSKLLLVGAAAYLFLLIWGIDPTAWLASAGIIGIAVGFAARDSLANLFSGVFIVADSPYKIGDFIVLDTGDRGMVTHVGMRSTRLLTRDDLEVTIPNALIANAKLINESGGPWVKSRIRIKIGVAYGSDLDQVCKHLVMVAEEHAGILTNPAPRVRMREFGVYAVNFELLGWIAHPEQRGKVTHEVSMAVYRRLRDENIEIPYPKQDLYIREFPETGPAAGNQD